MNFATWKVLRVFPLQSRCFASPPIGERSEALHWTGSEFGGTRCSVDPITVDEILEQAGIDPVRPQDETLATHHARKPHDPT